MNCSGIGEGAGMHEKGLVSGWEHGYTERFGFEWVGQCMKWCLRGPHTKTIASATEKIDSCDVVEG